MKVYKAEMLKETYSHDGEPDSVGMRLHFENGEVMELGWCCFIESPVTVSDIKYDIKLVYKDYIRNILYENRVIIFKECFRNGWCKEEIINFMHDYEKSTIRSEREWLLNNFYDLFGECRIDEIEDRLEYLQNILLDAEDLYTDNLTDALAGQF